MAVAARHQTGEHHDVRPVFGWAPAGPQDPVRVRDVAARLSERRVETRSQCRELRLSVNPSALVNASCVVVARLLHTDPITAASAPFAVHGYAGIRP